MADDDAIWRMLNARRVAVVGASDDQTKFSGRLVPSILEGGFTGEVIPVNLRAKTVMGLPAYANVGAIPGSIDLAVIAVPAAHVAGVMNEAADKGAAGAVVISAGGRESGNPAFEEELVQIATNRGLRFFGPNVQGICYGPNRLSAIFWPVLKEHGPLAVVGQSGTVVAAISDWAQEDGLGLCASVCLGNQADICEADVVRLLSHDGRTGSIALYLEGVSDGPGFVEAMRESTLRKPVAVLKCGLSERGREAVASHTGSLAGSDRVFAGVCRQLGLVRVDESDALYDAAKILACMHPPAGGRVLVISSSGGSCALAADAGDVHGLTLPPLPAEFVSVLRRMNLAAWGSFANPLDMATVDLERFRTAVQLADELDIADTFLIVFGDPIVGAAELVSDLVGKIKTPLCVAYYGGGELGVEERRRTQRGGVAAFPSPERAMKAIAASRWYGEWKRRHEEEQ